MLSLSILAQYDSGCKSHWIISTHRANITSRYIVSIFHSLFSLIGRYTIDRLLQAEAPEGQRGAARPAGDALSFAAPMDCTARVSAFRTGAAVSEVDLPNAAQPSKVLRLKWHVAEGFERLPSKWTMVCLCCKRLLTAVNKDPLLSSNALWRWLLEAYAGFLMDHCSTDTCRAGLKAI